MNGIRDKRRLITWVMMLCLSIWIGGDLLHAASHADDDSHASTESCLVCSFGHQSSAPSLAEPPRIATPHFEPPAFIAAYSDAPRVSSSPQPLVPRGPPFSL